MFCTACGGQLPVDARFCGFCGFRLTPIPAAWADLSRPLPPPTAEGPPIPLTRRKQRRSGGIQAQPRANGTSAPRRSPRVPLRVEVSFEGDSNFYTGFTENISHGGLFVATHRPLAMGALIDLTFTLPSLREPIHVVGRVKWVREYHAGASEGVPGMGVEFVSLGEREKRAIEMFLRHREPIFFDA